MIFTRDELKSMHKEALVRFCGYIGIELDKKDKKEDIIDLILEYYSKQEEVDDVPMSVRVRRIKESNDDN